MGILLTGNVTHNPLISELGYAFTPIGAIGKQLLPVLRVAEPAGNYPQWNSSDWNRIRDTLNTYGTAARRSMFKLDLDGVFNCQLNNWAVALPRKLKRIAVSDLDLATRAAEFAKTVVELEREKRIADLVNLAATWNASNNIDVSARALWSDEIAGDPIKDYLQLVENIRQRTAGRKPNVGWMNEALWMQIKLSPRCRELLFSGGDTGGHLITPQLFANFIGLEKMVIGGMMYTDTSEGVAEASTVYTDIWGNVAGAMLVTGSPSVLSVSAGYVLEFDAGARTWYEEAGDVDVVEWQEEATEKIICTAAGGILYNCI